MPDTRTLHSSRPVAGTPVDVVTEVGRVSARTVVGSRLEQELVLDVGSDAAGRRVRLGLGATVTVYWSLEEVRSEPALRGRRRPERRCADLAAAPRGTGRRRGPAHLAPRPLDLPVGLSMPSGSLLRPDRRRQRGRPPGDLPGRATSGFGDVVHPLPEAGGAGGLTVVLRRPPGRAALPGGAPQPAARRRAGRCGSAFVDLDRTVRSALRTATALELGRLASR